MTAPIVYRWLFFLGFSSLLVGCVSTPPPSAESFFVQTPETAKNRALQTRMFETANEKELLSASAAVLQDLGFQLEECIPDVGVLRAAKERSAREYDQEIYRVLIFCVGLVGQKAIIIPVDLHQQISASLVTSKSQTDATRFSVRVSFYRTIWKGSGNSGDQAIPPGGYRLEMIYDEKIYQQFFAKLSKSVFLEAHKI